MTNIWLQLTNAMYYLFLNYDDQTKQLSEVEVELPKGIFTEE